MAGFWCFVFSCVLAISCFLLYLYMEKTDFYRYYTYLEERDTDHVGSRHQEVIGSCQYSGLRKHDFGDIGIRCKHPADCMQW